MTSLREGRLVSLTGLQSNPSLNGAEGVIASWQVGEPHRFYVRLLRPAAAVAAYPLGVRVTPENLEILRAWPTDQKQGAGAGAAPCDDVETRRTAALLFAKQFAESLEVDEGYPPDSVEGIFGIEREPSGITPMDRVYEKLTEYSMGRLVYDTWGTLRHLYRDEKLEKYGVDLYDEDSVRARAIRVRVRREFVEDVAAALVEGRLPQWHEAQVRSWTERGRGSAVMNEICRRNFEGIPYDHVMLARLAGKA